MTGFDDDLRFAHVLADAADDITMRRFRALDLRVDAKPDLTPVSDADLATEEALRNLLRRGRPRRREPMANKNCKTNYKTPVQVCSPWKSEDWWVVIQWWAHKDLNLGLAD